MNKTQRHINWLLAVSAMVTLPATAAEKVTVKDSVLLEQALALQSLSIAPAETGFKAVTHVTLPNGKKKVRYQQTYHGLPVFDTSVVATETKSGKRDVYGVMAKGIADDVSTITPSIDQKQALSIAKAHFKRDKNLSETPIPEHENAKLMVRLDKNEQAQLVYMVDFFVADEHPTRPFFFIDAETGDILKSWEGLNHNEAEAEGPGGNKRTGKYVYGENSKPKFAIDKTGSTCTMNTSEVKTVNLNGGKTGTTAYSYTCSDSTNYNDYKSVNGAYSPLNDAQYYGHMIVDMYKEWLNTEPLSFQLVMRVHYGSSYENAFWDGSTMSFGDGASYFYPLVDINVSAHEVSHGFTEQNSGLVYSGQAGGINEAFSDIAGEAMEYYDRGKVDWLVGADIMKSGDALRYFETPSKDGSSIDNASEYTSNLNVHYSSGVYNRAYYLLSTKSGWNPKKGFQAFAYANKLYWTANATYDSAACGVAKAAKDLGYSVDDVVDAFKTVGVNADCDSSTSSNVLVKGTPLTDLSGAASSAKYYTFTVDSLSYSTVKTSGGSGDVDLYVKAGKQPTTSSYDCRPYKTGNTESCKILTKSGQTYYVMLRGYSAYSGVSLSLE
ncbi:M4 family metallopeptidase [Vibrio quintilis]|uniref:Neutral metalloproteinase n=1 Tax=Vibrio quintilis TaxID=1117707 RepID=A0A1M7YTJ3_9VIBR|nr:M4 family metallopeptidase [Vibrio quintilis]SHO55967.1 Neutral protease precursor [Vibrio quintilis]